MAALGFYEKKKGWVNHYSALKGHAQNILSLCSKAGFQTDGTDTHRKERVYQSGNKIQQSHRLKNSLDLNKKKHTTNDALSGRRSSHNNSGDAIPIISAHTQVFKAA